MNQVFQDFTETEYCKLLQIAKKNWKFISFNDYKIPGKVCLWRHDLDFSIHRAYRLAEIEAEAGVKSTYFIHLHNEFYHFLEAENTRLIQKILDLGHYLGLHFEPQFYSQQLETEADFLYWLKFEQEILERFFQVEIKVFSVHNPETSNWLKFNQDEIGGMINTYGQYFQQNYGYCSDSNGYWRFRRLRDVLEAAQEEKLQVLTHPAWWTPEPMSPRDRVSRCIDGRAAKQHQFYDELIQKAGRKNIKSEDAQI